MSTQLVNLIDWNITKAVEAELEDNYEIADYFLHRAPYEIELAEALALSSDPKWLAYCMENVGKVHSYD